MMSNAHTDVEEKSQSLWLLACPPTIWAVHFLGSYALAVMWCRGGGTGGYWLGVSIAAPAVVALALIAIVGWNGWKRHKIPGGEAPHDGDTDEDRSRFLGLATVLLAALSAIATVYISVAALIFGGCG